MNESDEIIKLRADIISYKIGYKDLQDHCADLERLTNKLYAENKRLDEYLTAEVEKLNEAMEMLLTDVRRTDLDMRDLKTENEKLRAALEPLACTCDRPNGAACSRSEVDCPFWNARAALEEKQ